LRVNYKTIVFYDVMPSGLIGLH